MTNISEEQAAYLEEVVRTRARYDRLNKSAAQARGDLDAIIKKGNDLGISTHRLATAASLTQPRVFQIIEAAKEQEREAEALEPDTSVQATTRTRPARKKMPKTVLRKDKRS